LGLTGGLLVADAPLPVPPEDWTDSLASWLAVQPVATIERHLSHLASTERDWLARDWRFLGRRNQQVPAGDWTIWLLIGGRGSGKTRTGAEATKQEVRAGRAGRGALVGPTAADVRDVMVEGESGILATADPWFRPTYEPSKRRLTWPNGALATVYSADEPDRLRGPQHDWFWADEIAAWRYPMAWDQLMLGLRIGQRPRGVATTTPKPVKLVRDLLQHPGVVVTRSTTYDNRANLAEAFLEQVVTKYEGTRLGRQELLGEVLEDVPGALWTWALLERTRLAAPVPPLRRVVVAVDPAVTSGEDADETGVVVVGLGEDGVGYVLDDRSGRMPAIDWATRAITAYHEHGADRVVAEVNNGGDLVENQLRIVDPTVSYRAVHASRGKRKRAEPIAALYEQGKIRHASVFQTLEDQMVTFVPDPDASPRASDSPDRVDALVWGLTDLMLKPPALLIA
jgi:phage terminase large subunit-like protein